MRSHFIGIVILAILWSHPALAGHGRRHADHERKHGNDRHDWARVVDVEPIYEQVRIVHPQRECRTEVVRRHGRRHRHSAVAPTLMGAALGGAIGRELGRDHASRSVGTVFGAIIGGSIAHEVGRASRHHRDQRHRRLHRRTARRYEVERCEIVDRVDYERRITGYDVSYRYHGQVRHTRMDRRPGDQIRVSVKVRPRYSH